VGPEFADGFSTCIFLAFAFAGAFAGTKHKMKVTVRPRESKISIGLRGVA
jgi:hypothetical protein